MTIKDLFYKNTELMLLICLITIAFAIYYFLITIEPFNGNYIPKSKRGYQKKIHSSKSNYNNYYPISTYNDYVELEKKIRNKHQEKGTDMPFAQVSDLNWRIHRWSMWDYLPNIDKSYYCKVQQYNGEDVCVPLSDKQYCNIGNLFSKPIDCLKSIKK
jgi:hypothetical protein